MRAVGLCMLAVACGGERAQPGKDAAPPRDVAVDAEVAIDAPVLPACAEPSPGTTLVVRKLAEGVNGFATFATAPRGDRRLFVLERGGAIRIYDAERRLLPAPFLDLGDLVTATAGEQGLLGLAFHPQYAGNGLFYVFYTHEQV